MTPPCCLFAPSCTPEDDATGTASGLVRATCRTVASAGASVPVTVQLTARQGACTGATASATATTTVVCCAGSGRAAGSVASVGTAGSSCWQHGAINATCTSSSTPAVAPLSSSYLNRGVVAAGKLRAGLQSGCAAGVDVGVASTTCIAMRTMAFNVTVGASSSTVRPYFWWGCRGPANITAAGSGVCATWRAVPAPGGQASPLQPSIVQSGAFTSYMWVTSIAPTAACDCQSMFWAVSVSGTFRTSGDCSGAGATAKVARLRGRRSNPLP